MVMDDRLQDTQCLSVAEGIPRVAGHSDGRQAAEGGLQQRLHAVGAGVGGVEEVVDLSTSWCFWKISIFILAKISSLSHATHDSRE